MKTSKLLATLLLSAFCCQPSAAQILNPGKVLEKKVINKTNQVINKKADQAVDSIFNAKNNPPANDNKPVVVKKTTSDTTIKPVTGNQEPLQLNAGCRLWLGRT